MTRLGKSVAAAIAERVGQMQPVWVLDGDLADSNGADHFAKLHPRRFLSCGIAEQNMVSVAAGLALERQRPFVFSFAAFLCYRAYDQIRVGISQTGVPVTLVGSHAGGLSGRNGKTHTAINDITVMASLPNLELWSPATHADAAYIVDELLKGDKPAYVRLPRDAVPNLTVPLTPLRWFGEKSRTAFISTGLATHWALAARDVLAAKNVKVGVLDCVKVWPIDAQTLAHATAGVDIAIVIEDHYAFGGLASCLLAAGLSCDIVHRAWPSLWSGQSGSSSELMGRFGFDSAALAELLLANMGG